jgi:hypothetical protein
MGRPTKYSPERAKAILLSIREANTLRASAEHGGISYQTFLNWMERGEAALSLPDEERTKEDARFLEFFDSVTRAQAEAEVRLVAAIQAIAQPHETVTITEATKTIFRARKTRHPDGTFTEEPTAFEEVTRTVTTKNEVDWRASAFLLERRFRGDWKETKDLRLQGDKDNPIETAPNLKKTLDELRLLSPEELVRLHNESLGPLSETSGNGY